MARTPQEQAQVDKVMAWYRDVLVPMDPAKVEKHLPANYIQHSSLAEAGLERLKRFLAHVRQESPYAQQTIHRAFVDGDHDIVHVHVVRWPSDPGLAVV